MDFQFIYSSPFYLTIDACADWVSRLAPPAVVVAMVVIAGFYLARKLFRRARRSI